MTTREVQDEMRGMKIKFVDLMGKFEHLQKKVAAQNAMAAQLEAEAQKIRAQRSNFTVAQSNPMPAMTAAGHPTPTGGLAKLETKSLKGISKETAAAPSSDERTPTDKVNVEIYPAHPTGLVPPPKDPQYEVPYQMRHPLNMENRDQYDDIKHYYNPNIYNN